MAESAQAHAEAHAHPNYVKIWGILVVLLVLSVLGPMLGIKIVTIIAAFGIAIVKAYLVVKNFMHVNVEPKFVTYLLVTALSFMALLFFFVAPDVMRHEGHQWENLAAKQASAEAASADEGPPFDAQTTFTTVCASCHGTGGKGDGPSAVSLNPKPANFTEASFWAERSRDDLMKVIKEGGVAAGKSPLMAAYGGVYNDEQIGQLVDLIEGFKPAGEPEPAATAGDAPDAADTDAPAQEAADTDAPSDEAADTDAPAEEAADTDVPAPEAKADEAKAG